jgi:hypothetical protein
MIEKVGENICHSKKNVGEVGEVLENIVAVG